jgi:hypothetical protein
MATRQRELAEEARPATVFQREDIGGSFIAGEIHSPELSLGCVCEM